MNKLLGFYELKDNGLPAVDWKIFKLGTELNNNKLWTIRSAVEFGDDLNLPRLIGVDNKAAQDFGNNLVKTLGEHDMVIYYPYFIAEKSGVIDISINQIVIEAVKSDLWNLVTHNKRDVSIIIKNNNKTFCGNEDFLSIPETDELLSYVGLLKSKYRDYLFEGKSIFLEWSFAYECDVDKNKIGERKLVFYEIRTV